MFIYDSNLHEYNNVRQTVTNTVWDIGTTIADVYLKNTPIYKATIPTNRIDDYCTAETTREKRVFNTQSNVGKAKYVVNYYNGASKNKDGSNFFDIAILETKIKFTTFINSLIAKGYKQTN